ncbi:MAG: low molecular weight phosphotyrosine protein phosphatase [Candidatus Hydrogenedentes bacterium]|nr:low molecular weight phosphotyrosine protein phosphatase [Candidatus Hydrogenedentota bacterium]
MVNVLFVCMGNICRSPTAEGIFTHLVAERNLADKIAIDSAGTLDYHTGEAPDTRAQSTALRHGISIGGLRARQVEAGDFERFHYVLGMDLVNMRELEALCPPPYEDRVRLLCEFSDSGQHSEVPDPYYGEGDGFEHVFEIVHDASEGLLRQIIQTHFPEHG